MSRIRIIIAIVAASALLAPAVASAQSGIAGEAGDAGAAVGTEASDADAGAAEPEEPVLEEPFVPDAPAEPPYDDAAKPASPEAYDDGKPFAKGDMEPGPVLGFVGYDRTYYMIVGGWFAYYVVNRLAPGLEVTYGTDFGSADIPDSVTLLPFLKFVILRSTKFAPYIIALGGREFQFNGYNAVHSWIVGGGIGMHIGLGSHVALRVEVTFQHHWYDDPRIRGVDDGRLYTDEYGNEFACPDSSCNWDDWEHPTDTEGNPVEDMMCLGTTCVNSTNDKGDLTHEWVFPIISVGMSFSF